MHREGKKFGFATNKTIRYGGKGMYTTRNTVEIKPKYLKNNDDYSTYIKLGKARCCTRCGGTRYSCKAIATDMNEYGMGIWSDKKRRYCNLVQNATNELIELEYNEHDSSDDI